MPANFIVIHDDSLSPHLPFKTTASSIRRDFRQKAAQRLETGNSFKNVPCHMILTASKWSIFTVCGQEKYSQRSPSASIGAELGEATGSATEPFRLRVVLSKKTAVSVRSLIGAPVIFLIFILPSGVRL